MQCFFPRKVPNKSTDPNASISLIAPCGKCYACLANKRSSWVFRMTEEFKNRPFSVFVTLTYDEQHCPQNVNKRDCQLFLKRLRKNSNLKFSYFLVSEYGTKFGRPHYHAILFFHEHPTYNDVFQYIIKSWQLGNVRVDLCNSARINYVTKYILKTYKDDCFHLSSRNPALGSSFLISKASNFAQQNNYVYFNGFKQAVPTYYKRKLNPDKVFTQDDFNKMVQDTENRFGDYGQVYQNAIKMSQQTNMSFDYCYPRLLHLLEKLKQIKFAESKQKDIL